MPIARFRPVYPILHTRYTAAVPHLSLPAGFSHDRDERGILLVCTRHSRKIPAGIFLSVHRISCIWRERSIRLPALAASPNIPSLLSWIQGMKPFHEDSSSGAAGVGGCGI
jgi:hypothetical protein